MNQGRSSFATTAGKQQGFTLIELMISVVVLTIGLVALLGVFGTAIATTQSAQQDLLAKQIASETMESIFTARNTSQLAWNAIQNTSNGGIFVDNPPFQPINNPGGDGILGTADDAAAGARTLTLPGPDGIVGTADDQVLPLTNYTRRIQITPVLDAGGAPVPTLRTVTITIRYTSPQIRARKDYILSAYISSYR
jgi:prepilin-type N-terminal cleavage/methylation domain-containing protein